MERKPKKSNNAPVVLEAQGASSARLSTPVFSRSCNPIKVAPSILITRATMAALKNDFPAHFRIAQTCLKDGRAQLVD